MTQGFESVVVGWPKEMPAVWRQNMSNEEPNHGLENRKYLRDGVADRQLVCGWGSRARDNDAG